MLDSNIKNVLFCNLFFACVRASGLKPTGETQDMTTSRANTLLDDADDLQKQLKNEANDKMKGEKANTFWVFHSPTQFPADRNRIYRPSHDAILLRRRITDVNTDNILSFLDGVEEWDYKEQSKWGLKYPDCVLKSQSPVDLPYSGLRKVTRTRQMLFKNHEVLPERLFVVDDGKNIKMSGIWNASKRPVIYGGAAHSRRYIFDSISLHWPSEHTINGLHYPIESQALYVSAEYGSVEEAQSATCDKMSLLGVASLYKISNHSHTGLRELLRAAFSTSFGDKPVSLHSLSYFNPPFKEYVSYHGSLTAPPCTESVKWLVRARSLPVTRGLVDAIEAKLVNGEPLHLTGRQTQPLNDRIIFFFD